MSYADTRLDCNQKRLLKGLIGKRLKRSAKAAILEDAGYLCLDCIASGMAAEQYAGRYHLVVQAG